MKKQQKFSDLSWITTTGHKPVEQMSVAEVMGPCPTCGGDYDRRGECPYCGDTVSPEQIAQRRQWLKDHPEER